MAAAPLEWDDALGLVVALLAGVVFFIAIRGYLRTPTTRVLLFASAFAVLFFKGLLKVIEVVWTGESKTMDGLELVADATVLGLFFTGMTRP